MIGTRHFHRRSLLEAAQVRNGARRPRQAFRRFNCRRIASGTPSASASRIFADPGRRGSAGPRAAPTRTARRARRSPSAGRPDRRNAPHTGPPRASGSRAAGFAAPVLEGCDSPIARRSRMSANGSPYRTRSVSLSTTGSASPPAAAACRGRAGRQRRHPGLAASISDSAAMKLWRSSVSVARRRRQRRRVSGFGTADLQERSGQVVHGLKGEQRHGEIETLAREGGVPVSRARRPSPVSARARPTTAAAIGDARRASACRRRGRPRSPSGRGRAARPDPPRPAPAGNPRSPDQAPARDAGARGSGRRRRARTAQGTI